MTAIAGDQSRTGALRAQWTLLNDPDRLRPLSDHYLSLHSVEPAQYARLEQLATRLPAVSTTPVADEPDEPAEIARPLTPQTVLAAEDAPLPEAAGITAAEPLGRPPEVTVAAEPRAMADASQPIIQAVTRPVVLAERATRKLAPAAPHAPASARAAPVVLAQSGVLRVAVRQVAAVHRDPAPRVLQVLALRPELPRWLTEPQERHEPHKAAPRIMSEPPHNLDMTAAASPATPPKAEAEPQPLPVAPLPPLRQTSRFAFNPPGWGSQGYYPPPPNYAPYYPPQRWY